MKSVLDRKLDELSENLAEVNREVVALEARIRETFEEIRVRASELRMELESGDSGRGGRSAHVQRL